MLKCRNARLASSTVARWHHLDLRVSVRDSTVLKNKQIFSNRLVWFFFTLRRTIMRFFSLAHMILYVHSHSCSLLLLPFKHTWAIKTCGVVHHVPTPMVDWPHYPLLQLGMFVDALTFFPWLLIWLCCPRSGREIQSSGHKRDENMALFLKRWFSR
jgi:hypothetical protein